MYVCVCVCVWVKKGGHRCGCCEYCVGERGDGDGGEGKAVSGW